MATDESETMSQHEQTDGETYRQVSIVQLTMPDPVNDHDEGFLDIKCEVLTRYEADTPMSKSNITDLGARKAQTDDDLDLGGGD